MDSNATDWTVGGPYRDVHTDKFRGKLYWDVVCRGHGRHRGVDTDKFEDKLGCQAGAYLCRGGGGTVEQGEGGDEEEGATRNPTEVTE
jgi:hypothetical protein